MSMCGRTWSIASGPIASGPIASGGHEVTVAEVGAGLKSYRHDGVDVTCSYGDDVLPPRCCGTTLVPWPNRIRGGKYTFDGVDNQLGLTEPDAGNAIHGLGRWARWSEVAHGPDTLTLGLDVVPQKGYPYEIHAELTYRVDAEHGLTVTMSARNAGASRAPFGAGSHPYLSTRGHRIDDVTLTLPAARSLVLDDHSIPVGTEPVDGTPQDLRAGRRLGDTRFDAGFSGLVRGADGRGVAELRTASGGARLWFDAAFGFLQVFTVDDLLPGESGVAIEPMSCAPDAFNSGAGLVVLEPGDTWTGSWGVVAL